MTKLFQPFVLAAMLLPSFAFAQQTTSVEKVKAAIGPTTTQATINNGQVTLVSPRTGISYSFANANNRPMVLETAKISAANSANVGRIVATNPALSASSQEQAKTALLNEAAQLAKN